MEEIAFARETDEASKERLASSVPTWPTCKSSSAHFKRGGSERRPGLNRVGELKELVDAKRIEAERAQREGDLATASELLYGEIPALEKQIADASASAEELDPMVRETVGADDVAEVVAAWTGIPAGRLLEGEAQPSSCGWRTSSASG